MLWVLKKTVSSLPSLNEMVLLSTKTNVKIDGLENIFDFMLRSFVYLHGSMVLGVCYQWKLWGECMSVQSCLSLSY